MKTLVFVFAKIISTQNFEIAFDAWFFNARRKCASHFACVHVPSRAYTRHTWSLHWNSDQAIICFFFFLNKDCYY